MSPLIHPQAPHGTLSGYSNWGCRCEACKKANTDAKASRRAIRLAERVQVKDDNKD